MENKSGEKIALSYIAGVIDSDGSFSIIKSTAIRKANGTL